MPKITKPPGRGNRRVSVNMSSNSTCITLGLVEGIVCSNCKPAFEAVLGLSKKLVNK